MPGRALPFEDWYGGLRVGVHSADRLVCLNDSFRAGPVRVGFGVGTGLRPAPEHGCVSIERMKEQAGDANEFADAINMQFLDAIVHMGAGSSL